jgi:hypothetical protein
MAGTLLSDKADLHLKQLPTRRSIKATLKQSKLDGHTKKTIWAPA